MTNPNTPASESPDWGPVLEQLNDMLAQVWAMRLEVAELRAELGDLRDEGAAA